jgi:hypothetical protein
MFHNTECETSNSQQQSGKKPKFDSKTLWKFYLQPIGSQTAKIKRGY